MDGFEERERALIERIDLSHRQYDRRHYLIREQRALRGGGGQGVLRLFAYKGFPRAYILMEGDPDEAQVDDIAGTLCSRREKTMVWYAQRQGFRQDVPERLGAKGNIHRFLEMTLPREKIPPSIDLGGLCRRRYAQQDVEACIELLERCYTPSPDPPGSFRSDRDRLAQLFAKADGARAELFCLEEDLVGLACHVDGDLEFLCVDPACQGRGYGSAMLGSILRAIAQDTSNIPRLTVNSDNHRAVALYLKTGFDRACECARFEIQELEE